MSEENKTLVRRMIQHLNEGNLDAMDEVFSPELAAIAKEGFAAFRLAFPDWREEIIDIVAEGDKGGRSLQVFRDTRGRIHGRARYR
jgi:hypothetical protein